MRAVDGLCNKIRLRRFGFVRSHSLVFACFVHTGVTSSLDSGFSCFPFRLVGWTVSFALFEVTVFGAAFFAPITAFAAGALSRIHGNFARGACFAVLFKETAVQGRTGAAFFAVIACSAGGKGRIFNASSAADACRSPRTERILIIVFCTGRSCCRTCPARLTAVAGAALDIAVGTTVLQSVVATALTVSDGADFQAVVGTGARPVRILTAVLVRAAMAVLQARLAFPVAVRIGRGTGAHAFACRTGFSAVARHVRTRVFVNASAAAVRDFSVGTAAFFAFGARFA